MKSKISLILSPLVAFVLYMTLSSSSGGITGQSVNGCTCHNASVSANTLVTITGLPSGGYTNGTVYSLTVTVTNTAVVAASPNGLGDGFDMTASAGTFTAIAGTAVTATPEIRHTARKAPTAGVASWTFNWTAPSTGNANITFNVAGNATNGDGSASTLDQWNKTSATIVKSGQALAVTASGTTITCNGNSSTITAVGLGGTLPYTYSRNGGTFQASGAFAASTAGTYTMTVKDATTATASTVLTITQPSAIVPTASNTPILCNGGTSTITAAATGGTGAYNYKLNAGAFVTSPIFTVNAAGIYTITVRDANLCTKTVLNTVAAAPALIVFGTPTLTQASCVGGTGSASITASGGTGTKTYTISPLGPQSNTTGSFTGLTAQTYTVTVTDANACTKTTAITISNPADMVFSTPTVLNPLCFGMITGTINTTVSGGTGTKTYTISPSGPQSNTTGNFSNLAAQSYTVTATDANLCTKTTVVVVTAPQNITFNSPTLNQPLCNGGFGSISISANGGTNPKTYTINPSGPQSNSTGIFTNLSAQNYTITVTDNNLCVLTTSLSLTNPTPVNITSATINQAVCFGSTSSANITASGGTSPYTYSITPLNTTNASGLFAGLVAGVYTVTASDANACSSNTVITITQPASFTVTPSVANMPCVNGTTTINASSSGGVGTINYAWYGQNFTSVNLTANKDNTIFEQNQGNSNGAGPYLGVGRNNQTPGYKTRAMISFNLSTLPFNAEIQDATLNLYSSQPSNIAGPQSHSLHKMLQNWGEGTSYSTQGGVGTAATSTDATWLSAFHTITPWTTVGGSFLPTSSASTIVDNAGAYSWHSNGMVNDLQTWLNNPSSNYGWMIKSNETSFPDAKRYDSREGNVPPSLDITYSTPILIGSGNTLSNAVAGTYTVVVMDVNGCTASNTIVISEVPCNSELQLTTFLQGYYIGASTMTTTMLNQNYVNAALDDVDDITVELHEVANPSNVVASTLARLKTNGIANCIFPPLNGNYYVVLNHRNSIQTWSADPVTISSSPATYNFSVAANKAYGNNMIEIETGIWAIYTGDLNQDGYIDGFDYPDFDTDSQNNVSGVYVATDFNGDGYVDGFDYPVFDFNSQNNVSAVTP